MGGVWWEDVNVATELAVLAFIVFRSNYWSLLLSFQDTTTEQTIDAPTLAGDTYVALERYLYTSQGPSHIHQFAV